MTKGELREIISSHERWLNGGDGECANLRGADLSRADLSDADLRGADLIGANLCEAYLHRAYLRGADMRDANLSGADMRDADLRGADLSDADLHHADLRGADLRGANLRGADLSRADLRGADLRDANLCDANLRCANLRRANLSGADLSRADLRGADLRDANLRELVYNECTVFYALQCPEDGSFIGYKKAHGHIVKLEILADAKRSSATSRKCRCSAAKVLSITTVDGGTEVKEIASDRDSNFIYRVGEVVHADYFDENRWNECSTGIHFFITRSEAEQYGE